MMETLNWWERTHPMRGDLRCVLIRGGLWLVGMDGVVPIQK